MKKAYLTLLLGFSSLIGYSQISGPDTVCLNTNVTFSTTYNAESYAWAIGDVHADVSGITASNIVSNVGYQPSGASIQYDNGNYYGFVTQRHGGLLRFDFGSTFTPSPTPLDLTDFNGALGDSTLGLDIVKDAANEWHGFSVDGKNLIHYYWGSNLSSTPVVNTMAFNNNFFWPYSITVKKYGNEWLAFVVNRQFNNIIRLDFGSSLSTTPTANTLAPSGGFLNAPINFALHQHAGSWYALITNIGSGGPGGGDKLVRWNFGTNLKNNAPAHTDLGNPGNDFSNPRGLAIITNCDTTFALVCNENNRRMVRVDFVGGVITGAPTSTDLGSLSVNSQTGELSTIWHDNKLAMLGSSIDSAVVLYDNVITMPASNSAVNFGNGSFSKGLSVGGTYDVSVFCNQGARSGGAAFCKKITVIGNIKVAIKEQFDTLVATGTLCDNYEWKFNGVVIPGAITQKHYPSEGSGIYTCTGNTAGCAATSNYMYFATGVNDVIKSDNVIISPNPTTGIFNVNMKGIDGKVTVQCYNVMGSLVASQTIEASTMGSIASIDLSNMAKGVYQVKIQTTDGANTVKQIVLQ